MNILVPSLVEESNLSFAENTVVEVDSYSFERTRDGDEDEVRNPGNKLSTRGRRTEPRHPEDRYHLKV